MIIDDRIDWEDHFFEVMRSLLSQTTGGAGYKTVNIFSSQVFLKTK
jgi:hypothetical protein